MPSLESQSMYVDGDGRDMNAPRSALSATVLKPMLSKAVHKADGR